MSNGDDMALTKMRVLLPTRRAGRELRDAFLNLSKGKPLLLPRLQPIGDVDAEEIELYLSGYGITGHDIPPAISSLERQFLLAPLIQKKDPELGLDAALSLANELARLIDTVHTEDMDFSGLQNIVPSNLSDQWQRTLTFLEIITHAWPHILAERGQIDPADRRNRLMKALAALWREAPSDTPVIAAGSTGSIPSAGELLKTIATLPQGVVVLPGLDVEMDDDSWGNITDTHPQATMRNLLNRMERTRADVQIWPEATNKKSHRAELIRAVMLPAESFGTVTKSDLINGMDNLNIIEAATPREEASTIALAIRETLETENKTACFITPDRTLARRVMTALHRWGIEVDDSAGGALATTGAATFFISLLRVTEQNFAPLELIDFLKHDYQRLIPKEEVAIFERYILRGARPAEGIQGLYKRLSIIEHQDECLPCIISLLEKHFAPLIELRHGAYSFDKFCTALIQIAEDFSGGKTFLWGRPEGNAFSNFMANLIGYAAMLPDMDIKIFGGSFRALLISENYRSDDEPHRRILILGQLESRLIRRDVMILGGLNEGTWPREVGHDPWMSRPMRRSFGLPPADRSTGLAAHDFAEHLSADKIFVTRSLKSDGTATVPARWVQKLKTLLNAQKIPFNWSAGSDYLRWVQQIDAPASVTPLYAATPAPMPPLAARPQVLSATWIEKWMKNPYRVYAEKILKLRILDTVDKDMLHAERGSFVHDVLMEFVKAYQHQMPDNAKDILLDLGRARLTKLENIAPHWHYWWPRFERIVDWFVTEETNWRKDALPWIQEETGAIEIYQNKDTGRSFKITAKADRIDRLKTGGVVVMDYKTGTPPSQTKIKSGTAPQLPIECLILQKGGYRDAIQDPQKMVYWKISGAHSGAGEINLLKSLNVEETIAATDEGLSTLVSAFENPETPYIAKNISGRLYDDEKSYAHLARTAEWSSGESGGDDDEGDDAE